MSKTQPSLRKLNVLSSLRYLLNKKITLKRYWQKILLLTGIFLFITITVVHLQYPKAAMAINTYYVATNGSDSNSGTQQYPFATIAYAANKAQPGDTIYIRGGTYYPTKEIWIGNKGTASAPIAFESYSGERAIIDGSNLPTNKDPIAIGGEYIDIKNLEIRNAPRTGLTVWGGNHIKLLNNVVHDINGIGIYVGHDNLKQVTDILIEGNTVYHTNLKNSSHNDFGGNWGNGITASGSDNIQVINNKVYENHGEGIGLWGSDILISGNTVYDNYSVEIYLDGVGNATVQRNLIYTTNNSTYYRFGHPAVGIQVANEGGKYQLQNNKIINNIVIGGGWGFYYGNYKSGGGMKNMLIANNTFYKGTRGLINIDEDAGHNKTVFTNNIFYQVNDVQMTQFSADSALQFHHNAWYGGSAGSGAGNGDVNANPMLVKPGTLTARDYRLKAGSPLIEAGSRVTQVTNDYAGSTRPLDDEYDIGAYEYFAGL
ncbi:MAG TPA: hypothetical protein DCL61_16005 [Cyanobacteria bacterium UBA12227]|nr:hypothetical protein [Cyanobacteria bacterium UBA12227]HAX85106.1 hypothetical protein [Cyanobacteria bacterium UBA11370]HBY77734.1 hypothetical protein [Cyanobacteria bacterium UBA11148]